MLEKNVVPEYRMRVGYQSTSDAQPATKPKFEEKHTCPPEHFTDAK